MESAEARVVAAYPTRMHCTIENVIKRPTKKNLVALQTFIRESSDDWRRIHDTIRPVIEFYRLALAYVVGGGDWQAGEEEGRVELVKKATVLERRGLTDPKIRNMLEKGSGGCEAARTRRVALKRELKSLLAEKKKKLGPDR